MARQAELVERARADERERCAKVAEGLDVFPNGIPLHYDDLTKEDIVRIMIRAMKRWTASAIRRDEERDDG
jgi:hypothetical protein